MEEGLTRRIMRIEPGRNNLGSFIFYFENLEKKKGEYERNAG